MATKKVEEESKKNKNKSVKSNNKNINDKNKNSSKTARTKKSTSKRTASSKTDANVKKTTKKETVKTKEVKEEKKLEMITCPKCGKEYLASLDSCPDCSKKVVVDDEEDELEDFEDYDDEDDLEVTTKKEKKKDKEKDKEEVVVAEKKEVIKKSEKLKKTKNKQNSVTGDNFLEQNADLVNLVKILFVVIAVIIVAYLAIAFINGEFKSKDKDDGDDAEVSGTIQNEKILASSIFSKSDSEYYVLAYNTDDEWADYYSDLYQYYKGMNDENALPLFWVDLNDKFNANIVAAEGEETNCWASNYEELRLKSPTLIRVKDGKNADRYEGEEATSILSNIIKEHSNSED